jgi:predicted DNA-binding protein (MmcQ/YjbR family)
MLLFVVGHSFFQNRPLSYSVPAMAEKGDLRTVSKALRAFALGFPEATEDFPWGERVAKVNKKVFVFLGVDPVPGSDLSLSVKLPETGEEALDLPFTKPTGYGLGKSGWVTATFGPKDKPPVEILKSWIRESYCAVAPKKLSATLAAAGSKKPQRKK